MHRVRGAFALLTQGAGPGTLSVTNNPAAKDQESGASIRSNRGIRATMTSCIRACAAIGLGVLLCSVSGAQVTQRVSVTSTGMGAQGISDTPSMTPDGRYVAFQSGASDLVPGDTNGLADVFVRDRQIGSTERVSIDSSGRQGNGDSIWPHISADGRYVVFSSWATNLVPGGTNGLQGAFLHDRIAGTTIRIGLPADGSEPNDYSLATYISADGRHVSIVSNATNLVPGDTNGVQDVFIYDRISGTTELISRTLTSQANGESWGGSLSADGRYVTFCSWGSYLVPGDTNGLADAFVRDRSTGSVTRVSVDSNGGQLYLPGSADASISSWISPDGRYVAFDSLADNLVPGDTNQAFDIFMHNCVSGTT